MKTLIIAVVFIAGINGVRSQQLVYRPINPAFGGDTFNYQWLLSSANAQNQFDQQDNLKDLLKDINSLDSFTQSLNRQVLSQLSRKLFEDQFGEGTIKPGTYLIGSLYLEVIETSNGTMITILDTKTGEQSELVVPKS